MCVQYSELIPVYIYVFYRKTPTFTKVEKTHSTYLGTTVFPFSVNSTWQSTLLTPRFVLNFYLKLHKNFKKMLADVQHGDNDEKATLGDLLACQAQTHLGVET